MKVLISIGLAFGIGFGLGVSFHRYSLLAVNCRRASHDTVVIMRVDSLTGRVAWTFAGNSSLPMEDALADWVWPDKWIGEVTNSP